jgi:hypothetical protein
MPQDSIDLLVRRALRGAEVVVASPATIQKAIEKGEPITEPPSLSAEDAITKLFDQRRQHALSLVSSFLPCPVADTANKSAGARKYASLMNIDLTPRTA